VIFLLFELAVLVGVVAGLWKTLEKAGKPGWVALVPIYNAIVLLEVAGKPTWWVVLCFVPLVNFVILFIIATEMAKAFGKDVGFAVGLFFLPFVFYAILGFGDARYRAQAVS
jgi:Family of unknown function (DUF5684)